MGYLHEAGDQISDFCHQQLLKKMRQKISWTDRRTEVKQYIPHPLRGAGYKRESNLFVIFYVKSGSLITPNCEFYKV